MKNKYMLVSIAVIVVAGLSYPSAKEQLTLPHKIERMIGLNIGVATPERPPFVGYNSLLPLTTGAMNTAIGYQSSFSSSGSDRVHFDTKTNQP